MLSSNYDEELFYIRYAEIKARAIQLSQGLKGGESFYTERAKSVNRQSIMLPTEEII